MRRCPVCDARFESEDVGCPRCGSAPAVVDGLPAFAPDLAHVGEGFKASYFADLAGLEESSFWFRARNDFVCWAIRRYAPAPASFLEIGCGTGFVLAGIADAFPTTQLTGSEVFTAGLAFAAARVPRARFMQMDARHIPFREEFDTVGAFDVLEHIEEDERVLAEMHAALRPKGRLFLTVPQHEWLWSVADDYACHVRRYTADEIHRKLDQAGFSVLRSTSFVSLLLPLMVASRWTRRGSAATYDPNQEFKLPHALNETLFRIMRTELRLVRAGVNLPVGGSRLVVAARNDSL